MPPVRVLVVDDEPLVLKLLSQMLSQWGAVVEVADGPAALRLLVEREFALVLSDTQMPEVDGLKVLEAAKRHCPNAIRVLMSGDPSALARGEGDASPAHALLYKPIDRGRLRQLLGDAAFATLRLGDLLESMRRRYADSADAVFVKDRLGRYLFMNATGAALLQRPVEEVVGRLDSEIFDMPTLTEEVRGSDQEVLRTRRHYLYVNATRNPGTARTFLSAKFPVFDAGGEIQAIGCLSRDVTELMGLTAADSSRKVEDLMRDLYEAAAILDAGTNPATIDRPELDRCLQFPSTHESFRSTATSRGESTP